MRSRVDGRAPVAKGRDSVAVALPGPAEEDDRWAGMARPLRLVVQGRLAGCGRLTHGGVSSMSPSVMVLSSLVMVVSIRRPFGKDATTVSCAGKAVKYAPRNGVGQ